ncbi:hemolysin XhlA family protein [Niallia taxi]|uniref:Holin n=1 Tax=Niallia taxi TaxID=2499688 RepID=A0A3S2WZB8_9BACI|nr:hemolysin XhlA family protein [Niallia taxi]RVT57414.1 holin [Niallia taxi]
MPAEDMNDKIAEIREWLVRLDTKLDYMHDVKRTAESADDKATEALSLAQKNHDDIRDMKANSKWAWGTIFTVAGLLLTFGIAVFT